MSTLVAYLGFSGEEDSTWVDGAILGRPHDGRRARLMTHRGHRRRAPLLVQHADDGLAGAQRREHPAEVHRADREGGDRLLEVGGVGRGVGAQRVLHPAAELSQDLVGDVRGRLGDEDDAHALGADEPHRAHHGLQEGLRGAGEQQVRLIEEEHHGGLVRVADLRQGLEELSEQPHEEGREQGAL